MNKLYLIFVPFIIMTAIALPAQEINTFGCIDLSGIPNVGASSNLPDERSRGGEEGDWKKYHESNLFDGITETAWVEGVPGSGIGEKVWFDLEEGTEALVITNGYAQNASLFAKNGRVKSFMFSLWAACRGEGMITEIGAVFEGIKIRSDMKIALNDTMKPQKVLLAVDWKEARKKLSSYYESYSSGKGETVIPAYFAMLEIREVYPGSKYDDTCVAEIGFVSKPEEKGPGGITRRDISGSWFTQKGADWEVLVFDWNPLEQRYSTYLHGKPYDTGSWAFNSGALIMESDSKGMILSFPVARRNERSLVLVDDMGNESLYSKD